MRILIADDHALFRDGLTMHLERIAPDATIVQSSTYSQTLKILEQTGEFDLIILDLDMPDMNWEKGYEELKKYSGPAKFVIISASEDVRDIRKSLEMGAVGYIPKSIDTKILTGALKLILDGGTYLPPSLINAGGGSKKDFREDVAKVSGKTAGHLTKRQSQVLELIAKGKSNKQIAYELSVSEATVKLHINALLRALDATNRTQALIIAQQKGLI